MTKELERLIKYIRKEDVALFIGSGFSFKAGAPHVCDIIEAILKEGGEDFASDNGNKSLRDVSESFVELCNGRNDLISLLNKLFNFEVQDTSDQDMLRKIPHFKEIFTTNYDTLIESAYPTNERLVITSNEGCSYASEQSVKIYKVHGDITTLNSPDGIIITESDYQNYFKSNRYELIWETLKLAFTRKHMLFIGYSLEDDNILEIIKNVRDCVGSNMKGIFFVAPSILEVKQNQLRANHISYIDASAEEVLASVLSSLKDNIADDVRHNNVRKETYDRFVELNADIFSTLRKTEEGNVIEKIAVKEGHQRNERIQFEIPAVIKEEIDHKKFNDKVTVFGSSIQVPAYRIAADKMIKFNHYINGIRFNGKEDISSLLLAPQIIKKETKFKIPSIKFAEPVIVVQYSNNNVLHIDIEAPICYIKLQLHFTNNKVSDVSTLIESKDTYKNNAEALKWIDALIAMSKKGQTVKIDGINLTANSTSRRSIAEYNKVKKYYKTISDIENETEISFNTYNQFSEANYLNALYIYHYLTGTGFTREVPENATLSFVIDSRDENNMPIDKFRKNNTFVMIQCDPLGPIELNGVTINIPFRTTVYMDCHADSITSLNDHDYEIVMKDAKTSYQTWCSDSKPKQEGNVLHMNNKKLL